MTTIDPNDPVEINAAFVALAAFDAAQAVLAAMQDAVADRMYQCQVDPSLSEEDFRRAWREEKVLSAAQAAIKAAFGPFLQGLRFESAFAPPPQGGAASSLSPNARLSGGLPLKRGPRTKTRGTR